MIILKNKSNVLIKNSMKYNVLHSFRQGVWLIMIIQSHSRRRRYYSSRVEGVASGLKTYSQSSDNTSASHANKKNNKNVLHHLL